MVKIVVRGKMIMKVSSITVGMVMMPSIIMMIIVYLIIFNSSMMMNHFRHCTSRALLLGSEKLYKLSKAKPIWRTILLSLRRKRSFLSL